MKKFVAVCLLVFFLGTSEFAKDFRFYAGSQIDFLNHIGMPLVNEIVFKFSVPYFLIPLSLGVSYDDVLDVEVNCVGSLWMRGAGNEYFLDYSVSVSYFFMDYDVGGGYSFKIGVGNDFGSSDKWIYLLADDKETTYQQMIRDAIFLDVKYVVDHLKCNTEVGLNIYPYGVMPYIGCGIYYYF